MIGLISIPIAERVSRFGEMPKPTVIVRMKENGTTSGIAICGDVIGGARMP